MSKDKTKILIVDDKIENLIALETLLVDFDIEIIRALSGFEALTHTFNNDFALAIMDVQMPEMDGFETVKLLRKAKSTKHLPVIFVSAIYKENTHIIKGIESGGVDFIIKPLNREILCGKVKIFLELHKHRTKLEELVSQQTKDLVEEIHVRREAEELLKIQKEKAESSTHAMSIFLASMSHEIRTPMNGIIGMSNLLKETKLNDSQKELVDIIHLSGNNLITIINDILDFSKIESNQVELENIEFNLFKLVEDIYKLLQIRANENRVKLIKKISPAVQKVIKGDPVRLKQILINLLNNAIKFTDKGSVTLKLNIREKTNKKIKLYFEVEDTGIGISEEGKKNLFNVFKQSDSSINRKYGGTGLGLAISKNLSKLMGGEIGVESKYGKGSNFWFTAVFDRVKQSVVKLDENQNIIHSKSSRKLQILLAEDNVINQKVAVYNLQKFGHEIDIAENGKIAVEKYQKNKYDAILMDIHMPEMSGIEATAEIRRIELKNKAIGNIKIIAMTANALKGDREKLLATGMNEYISKPFKPEELKKILVNITNENEA
ncbi:MAG: response regulator [Bacteroidetes bacterium]|jgi:two-component system, sensor histidine kinase|nr:response regulator [Bacteroidota bacterium]MBT6687280.1 response regulator [Bacteroidota bacterium]MBT7144499.1 response regulator [Bacteroidota bacterium]MBT7493066.1 response regulator [Bacteroidota bacterium]